MAYPKPSTKHRTFTHLNPFQRGQIQALHQEHRSSRDMAREIGCTHQTVLNELRRGTTTQIGPNHQRFQAYFLETGQAVYERNRHHCGRRIKLAAASDFIAYAENKMLSASQWSPDAVCGAAGRDPKWKNKVRVCTRTLYHYIDLGILRVTNMDLPDKLRYRTKKSRHRPNIKHLGDSIDNRPAEVLKRRQFGHWEIDTVVGKKSRDDDVLLTLVERKTRFTISRKIEGKDPDSVGYAMKQLEDQYGPLFGKVFRTITADNGSEFAGLANNLNEQDTHVYYTHPYAAWERPTNERHNEMIRRFIPKGHPISNYSRTFISQVIRAIDHLPRRILNYRTPAQEYQQELRKLAG
ncbi:IS30 family transposase [Sporolactobacillus putidus]|uniref:IS30 family transposase n=1 Tax=Sporolactobacillus putidus TaxID=492735 RepID=A0A917W2U5_9BACL|nr:IS30 family transposase [Sporolactobacillus putidus]GGL61492.1 IS30 family transposase [Sporolactobacillus putidus]